MRLTSRVLVASLLLLVTLVTIGSASAGSARRNRALRESGGAFGTSDPSYSPRYYYRSPYGGTVDAHELPYNALGRGYRYQGNSTRYGNTPLLPSNRGGGGGTTSARGRGDR